MSSAQRGGADDRYDNDDTGICAEKHIGTDMGKSDGQLFGNKSGSRALMMFHPLHGVFPFGRTVGCCCRSWFVN